MKKTMNVLLALIVCISVVCTTFSITVFAESSVKVSPVYIESADGSITASAVVSNIDGTSETSVKLYLAQYTQNGVEAKSAQVTVPAGGEKIVSVSDTEVADATVRCFLWEGDNCTPLSVPADKNAAAELTGISVNGNLLNGFTTATTSYSISVESGAVIPVIKGIPVDNALISKTVYNEDNTVTVTVSNPITDSSKVYTITWNAIAPQHAVTNATTNEHFEIKTNVPRFKTNGELSTVGTINAVASVAIGGDGILYQNLHAATISSGNVVDTSNSGSMPYTNFYNYTPSSYWVISEINDASAVGADYFAFKSPLNTSKTFGTVNYDTSDATKTISTLSDGVDWIKFNLSSPARVTIYVATNMADTAYVSNLGWTLETVPSSTPHIKTWRADKNGTITVGYRFKIYKDYPAGEVVVPYYAKIAASPEAPIITVVPGVEIKDTISDFTNIVDGKTFDEYKVYAGEEITAKDEGCDGTLTYKVELKENFGIGSVVDRTSAEETNVYKPRKVSYVNPLYNLEGCYYVNFDKYVTNSSGNIAFYKPWVKEAFSGYVDMYSDKVGVGFKNIVPWVNFKVNTGCDVLVASVGELPDLKSRGYIEVVQGTYNEESEQYEDCSSVFETVRYDTDGSIIANEGASYTYLYIKPFEAGSVVELYNAINGFNECVYLVRPR